MPAPRRPRAALPTTALYVRIPSEQAERLDRAAFALGRAKQDLVSSLLERYVDPDSPKTLAALDSAVGSGDRRRITIESLEPGSLAVGHHSFRPREPEVLTLDEAAELLAVEPAVVEQLARDGEIPARRLGGEWRLARRAVLDWLARGEAAPGNDDEER